MIRIAGGSALFHSTDSAGPHLPIWRLLSVYHCIRPGSPWKGNVAVNRRGFVKAVAGAAAQVQTDMEHGARPGLSLRPATHG